MENEINDDEVILAAPLHWSHASWFSVAAD
jgi:hypothetical protein